MDNLLRLRKKPFSLQWGDRSVSFMNTCTVFHVLWNYRITRYHVTSGHLYVTLIDHDTDQNTDSKYHEENGFLNRRNLCFRKRAQITCITKAQRTNIKLHGNHINAWRACWWWTCATNVKQHVSEIWRTFIGAIRMLILRYSWVSQQTWSSLRGRRC